MERWIDAIKRCFAIDEPLVGTSCADTDFEILDGSDRSEVIKVLGGNGAIAYSWNSGNFDYLFAVGKVEVSDPHDQELAIDELFGRLYGRECEADIFSMRDVIIDDMRGVEICGIADGHEETVFYALYLADNGSTYFAAGFSEGDADSVFDEFSGAARTFYRKPAPATLANGKNTAPLFSALRALATRTMPDTSSPHVIRNTTFDVTDGVIAEEFAVLGISDDNVEQSSGRDFYEGIDVTLEAGAFLTMLGNKHDISGFTMTCFKDGRYGATIYPLMDEELDEELDHEHDENCGCDKAKTKDEIVDIDDGVLEERLAEFASKLAAHYPKGWQKSLNFIIPCDNEESDCDEWVFDTLVSTGDAYKGHTLPDSFDSEIESELAEIGELLNKYYDEWSLFSFTFEKDSDTGDIDAFSMSFRDFSLDDYFDGCGSIEPDGSETLSTYTHLFYDELNGSAPVISASFKIAHDQRSVFFVEAPYIVTDEGATRLDLDDAELEKLLADAGRIFETEFYGDVCTFTLFPDAKIGAQGDDKLEEIVLDLDAFRDTIIESELAPYEKQLTKILRKEISAEVYIASEEDMVECGVSKAGGSPDLAIGQRWPSDSKGTPMLFVAQINLEETAAFDLDKELPKKGHLTFFYNEASNEGKVLYTDSYKLERITLTDALERGDIIPTGDMDDWDEFSSARLRFWSSVSLPSMIDGAMTPSFIPEDMEEAYQDMAWLNDRVKMFGYPFLPAEETEMSRDKNMKVLFQIPSLSECGMSWGDGGTLYFWIHADDLKKLCFENCVCEQQAYGEF